jgi:hypothetical protein
MYLSGFKGIYVHVILKSKISRQSAGESRRIMSSRPDWTT